jgi:hypothetical protein
MRSLVALLLALSMIVPRLAHAQEIVTLPPGEDQIVAVKKGQEAPWAGQLFSTDTALRWGFFLEQFRFRLKSDVELEKQRQVVQSAYYESLLRTEREKYTTVTLDLTSRLKTSEGARQKAEFELSHPPWYTSAWFPFAAGIIVMGAAVGLSAWGLSK